MITEVISYAIIFLAMATGLDLLMLGWHNYRVAKSLGRKSQLSRKQLRVGIVFLISGLVLGLLRYFC